MAQIQLKLRSPVGGLVTKSLDEALQEIRQAGMIYLGQVQPRVLYPDAAHAKERGSVSTLTTKGLFVPIVPQAGKWISGHRHEQEMQERGAAMYRPSDELSAWATTDHSERGSQ